MMDNKSTDILWDHIKKGYEKGLTKDELNKELDAKDPFYIPIPKKGFSMVLRLKHHDYKHYFYVEDFLIPVVDTSKPYKIRLKKDLNLKSEMGLYDFEFERGLVLETWRDFGVVKGSWEMLSEQTFTSSDILHIGIIYAKFI